jgi:hypothetical protein
MPMVKINGIAYEFDHLSDEVKGQLSYLSFIDAELEQLGMRQNVLRIARDQVGQRLDAALLRDSVNQSPTDGAQVSTSKPSALPQS